MFDVPKEFWVPDDELFKQDARDEFRPRFGLVVTGRHPYSFAELEFKMTSSICHLNGATGSGKSALLNTILYNAISAYSPESLAIYMMDCKDIDLAVYAGMNVPHIAYVQQEGSKSEAQVAFLQYVISEIKQQSSKVRFIVIDEYHVLYDHKDLLVELCNLVTNTPNTYMILSSQAWMGMEFILDYCPMRLCLRASREVAYKAIGTDAPAYASDKFSCVWYAPNIVKYPFGIKEYRHPFIPDERIWDMARVQKKKTEGRLPVDALPLLYKAAEMYKRLPVKAGVVVKHADAYALLDSFVAHVVCMEGVNGSNILTYIATKYSVDDLDIMYVNAQNVESMTQGLGTRTGILVIKDPDVLNASHLKQLLEESCRYNKHCLCYKMPEDERLQEYFKCRLTVDGITYA